MQPKNNKPIEKPKRKQVKNACVNCQKACKKCDDGRPCARCIKLGLTSTCRDSDRKERKRGVKRGPYKKRQAYIKDQPVYPKETFMVPSQWNNPSPANSFDSFDETLHGYNYFNVQNDWETDQLEKLLSLPMEQSYELDLLQEPYVWYPVQPTVPQSSFFDYSNIPLQYSQWS